MRHLALLQDASFVKESDVVPIIHVVRLRRMRDSELLSCFCDSPPGRDHLSSRPRISPLTSHFPRDHIAPSLTGCRFKFVLLEPTLTKDSP